VVDQFYMVQRNTSFKLALSLNVSSDSGVEKAGYSSFVVRWLR
jgi:hypothetical protein